MALGKIISPIILRRRQASLDNEFFVALVLRFADTATPSTANATENTGSRGAG